LLSLDAITRHANSWIDQPAKAPSAVIDAQEQGLYIAWQTKPRMRSAKASLLQWGAIFGGP